MSLLEIGKASRVLSRLYVGNWQDAQEVATENPHGIGFILNVCSSDWKPNTAMRAAACCLACEIHDGQQVPAGELMKALSFLDWTLKEGGKVLVHCAAGISRSPSIVIAHLYRMGMSWEEAFNLVKYARPIIQPHAAVTSSIKRHLGIVPEGA